MTNTLNNGIRYVVISLMFAVLFVPLVVATNLYFPYITGKAFLFRTLVDVSFALYLILVIRDRSYLPKRSVVLWSLAAFLGIMAMATITSVDPMKSFWSNFERMEGYVTMLYLGAYFLVLSNVFNKRNWFWFFHASLFASLLVGIGGFADLTNGSGIERIAGALGNSSYLGVYALIHMFLAAFFFLSSVEATTEKKESIYPSLPWLVGYVFFILFNGAVLYQTGTRGSFVGLIVGGFITALLLGIFEKKHRIIRRTGQGIIVAVVVLVLALGLMRNTSFVQSHDLLARFSSLITPNVASVIQNQGYARTVLWSMSYHGFLEKPLLGWGEDDFNYVFSKYYDPRMWNQEQWFDRSHDVFFDWLIAGGMLGLLAYLSFFAAIIYLLWFKSGKDPLNSEWSVAERSVLTGLLIAYFIHNLFVFDNLASYILFFALLAYVHARSAASPSPQATSSVIADPVARNGLLAVVVAVVVGIFYYSVFDPYMACAELLDALRGDQLIGQVMQQEATSTQAAAIVGQSAPNIYADFVQALSRNTFGTPEIREQLSNTAISMIGNPLVDRALASKFNDLVNQQYALQEAETPMDPRYFVFYGVYLNSLGQYDAGLDNFNKALALSPKKQPFLFQAAEVYYAKKDYPDAIADLKKAYEEDTTDTTARDLYAAMLVYSGDVKDADSLIAGTNALDDSSLIQAYAATKNYAEVIAYIKKKLSSDPQNPQLHISLAAGYISEGDAADAIAELKAAILIAPSFAAQGNALIKEIQSGKNPAQQAAPAH